MEDHEDPHSKGGRRLLIVTAVIAALGVTSAVLGWPFWVTLTAPIVLLVLLISLTAVVGSALRRRHLAAGRERLRTAPCAHCKQPMGEVSEVRIGQFPASVWAKCPLCGREAHYSVDPTKTLDGSPLLE